MEIFHNISKWFWAICILVMLLNGGIFWLRAQKHIKSNPELKKGYEKLLRGFLTWGNLPWIVMGVGITVGGVSSIWDYFNPREGNLYVLAFFITVILIWVLGSYWLFVRNGAVELAAHPGLFNHDIQNPTLIKLIWAAGVLGGMVAVFMMYVQAIPLPKM